jgi:hypothetical protein
MDFSPESVWLQALTMQFAWRSGVTSARTWLGQTLSLPRGSTHYVFVQTGKVSLDVKGKVFPLASQMYAAVPGECTLHPSSTSASGLVVSHGGYEGMFQLGGPLERTGRLRYIDGCTDSLLLAPPMMGDPCLNHLHIPANTTQTRHTHPSVRVGLVVKGEGACVTPEGELALHAGLAFMLAPGFIHSFRTYEHALDVVVYHPETDTGPTHEDHPMLNRTHTIKASRA